MSVACWVITKICLHYENSWIALVCILCINTIQMHSLKYVNKMKQYRHVHCVNDETWFYSMEDICAWISRDALNSNNKQRTWSSWQLKPSPGEFHHWTLGLGVSIFLKNDAFRIHPHNCLSVTLCPRWSPPFLSAHLRLLATPSQTKYLRLLLFPSGSCMSLSYLETGSVFMPKSNTRPFLNPHGSFLCEYSQFCSQLFVLSNVLPSTNLAP